MALIAGTFVLTSGEVYFVFMAAWLNVVLVIGFSSLLYTGLGLLALIIGAINVKDFLRPGLGISLSIPTSAKPGLYARMRRVMTADRLLTSLAGVAVQAVVVNFIELLCTAGFPTIYTAVLTQQQLPAIEYYVYLAPYIVGYIADDSLMVGTAVFALSTRKLTERAGRQLKLLSEVVMLALGEFMGSTTWAAPTDTTESTSEGTLLTNPFSDANNREKFLHGHEIQGRSTGRKLS